MSKKAKQPWLSGLSCRAASAITHPDNNFKSKNQIKGFLRDGGDLLWLPRSACLILPSGTELKLIATTAADGPLIACAADYGCGAIHINNWHTAKVQA
jgi:hypothetical protein